ncbi:hypothetical protein Bca52824_003398 [Brassica carinata]|uniref:Uncharacterized protein n=1 Tax=Brassica carinata TaxID=52824 RepID=A0A8X7WQ60_BRACI|nr:hypothetical protein Bca52824_003398 [Brassica carinata]
MDLQYYEQVDEAEVTGKDIMNVVGFQVLYSQTKEPIGENSIYESPQSHRETGQASPKLLRD